MEVIQPLIGGVVIGFAAFVLHIFVGRIAGISGIVGRLLPPTASDWSWRVMFLVGLVAGGAVMMLIDRGQFAIAQGESLGGRVVVAGLLVGFGTRLGSGCTSGHGVCGISRLSPRSLVATMVFIVAGVATVAGVTP